MAGLSVARLRVRFDGLPPHVSSSWASTKARFGKNGAPRARRRMAKRRAGAAGTCLLPRRSGGSRAEIATCALPPPRRPIVQDDRQPRPPLWGSGSRRQVFRPDPRKIFRNQKDHNGHGTLEASRGGRDFLYDTGRGTHTREVSISSPRRATAGIRLSIGVEATPFFRLNAVSAIGGQGRRGDGRARPCSCGKGHRQRRPAASQALGPARWARSSNSKRNDRSSRRTPIWARVTSLGSQVVIALARACVVGWPSPSTTPAAPVRGLSVHLHAGGVREAKRARNWPAWSLFGHSETLRPWTSMSNTLKGLARPGKCGVPAF